MPDGMESGFYKYVVFDTPLKEASGKVYADLCHVIRRSAGHFPHSEWVAGHHACPPIHYGYARAVQNVEELRAALRG